MEKFVKHAEGESDHDETGGVALENGSQKRRVGLRFQLRSYTGAYARGRI